MQNQFARLLQNQQQVNHFLSVVLNVNRSDYEKKIAYSIMTAEKGVIDGLNAPTFSSPEYRDVEFSSEAQRNGLRNRIVDELLNFDQLENDDEITLGNGGAKPSVTQATQDAFILTGLPASGKSSIATIIANTYGAYILDSDFAKRKLPEYDGFPWGASIVHAESRHIVFGPDTATFESLFTKVAVAQNNLIIPTIGSDPKGVMEYAEILKELGYKVHLTLVYLPKEKATIRALKRFNDTNRYVPLSLVFDVYSENAALTYFLLRDKTNLFSSFGVINTDVPKGESARCTDLIGDNPARLFRIDENVLI